MRETIFIKCDRWKVSGMTKNQPSLAAGERYLSILIDVPDEYFTTPPLPSVEVRLNGKQIGGSRVVIDGQEVATPIDEIMRQQLVIQHQFAEMYLLMRSSSDPVMQQKADEMIQALIASGVEVRIATELPDESQQDTKEELR